MSEQCENWFIIYISYNLHEQKVYTSHSISAQWSKAARMSTEATGRKQTGAMGTQTSKLRTLRTTKPPTSSAKMELRL